MKTRAMLGFALAGVVAVGCKDEGPGIHLDDAPQAIARTVCPRAYECCTMDQLKNNDQAGTDAASCEAKTTEGFHNHFESVKRSQDQGRVAYHGDKLARCLDFIRGARCDELRLTDHFSGLPCEAWVEPKVTPGGTCSTDGECIDGFCQKAENAPEGVCMALPRPGEACHEGRCVQGLVCDSAAKTCAVPVVAGGMCSEDDQCATGNCAGGGASIGTCAAAEPNKCFYSSACAYGRAPLSAGWATAGLAGLASMLARRRRRNPVAGGMGPSQGPTQ